MEVQDGYVTCPGGQWENQRRFSGREVGNCDWKESSRLLVMYGRADQHRILQESVETGIQRDCAFKGSLVLLRKVDKELYRVEECMEMVNQQRKEKTMGIF